MIFDSTTRYKTFFDNRLSKIHAGSTIDEWNYVDSASNPADFTSRGIRAHETEKWKVFHGGPSFLRDDESKWPKMHVERHPRPPVSAFVFAVSAATDTEDPEEDVVYKLAIRRGDWTKKLRLIAVLRKVVKRWKATPAAKTRATKKSLPNVTALTQDELTAAERELIESIQKRAFGEEIDELLRQGKRQSDSRGNAALKNKSLRHHNPFVDDQGVMRIGSRLVNADICDEAKFPAILPPKDENVQSLVFSVHSREMHAGPKHTLNAIRQRYWINRGLQTTKSVIARCVKCQRNFKRPENQRMAPLPERRVKELAPFEESGVDLMGHFFVKMNGRANHKVWIAVFTCLVTRSVHTELLYNLDADSMINAIVRFAARRPGVRRFTSDQGTNLVGANNVLKKEMQSWNASSTQQLQRRGLEWEFIPASTPHYGGCWERVVGLFKRHLASISSGDVLHVDTFNTAVIEAEGILNQRPLTTLSDDPRDSEPLTPTHILYPAMFSPSSAFIMAPASGKDTTGS